MGKAAGEKFGKLDFPILKFTEIDVGRLRRNALPSSSPTSAWGIGAPTCACGRRGTWNVCALENVSGKGKWRQERVEIFAP